MVDLRVDTESDLNVFDGIDDIMLQNCSDKCIVAFKQLNIKFDPPEGYKRSEFFAYWAQGSGYYQGEVTEHGMWNGKGVWIGLSGVYTGYWVDGNMQGHRYTVTNDGWVRTGSCKNGHWYGKVLITYPSGRIQQENYDNEGKRITESMKKTQLTMQRYQLMCQTVGQKPQEAKSKFGKAITEALQAKILKTYKKTMAIE